MRIRKFQASKFDPVRLIIQRKTGNGDFETVAELANDSNLKLARLQYGAMLTDLERQFNGKQFARQHIAAELIARIPGVQLRGWFKHCYDRSQINHEVKND